MTTDLKERLQAALGDAYVVERELSGGRMSRLFLATERSLERPVVIKVLPPELTSEVSLARFQRETQVTALLQHPHILPVHAAGARDGLLYYVTPFIEGESLRHRLERERQLPIVDALRILREVADGLAFAHARGILHRDVKPENILLEHGHALVADFGIARALEAARTGTGHLLTETGVPVGTPGYMAPEQLAAEPHIDARADVYALAVVGYEMLAGRPPFIGSSQRALLSAHLTELPTPLDELRPDTPPHVSAAVMKALAKSPDDRLQTAAALRDALDRPAEAGARRSWSRRLIRSIRARISRRAERVALATIAVISLSVAAFAVRPKASPLDPQRVLVTVFENQAGHLQFDNLGQIAADWIGRGLAETSVIEVIDPAWVLLSSSAGAGTDGERPAWLSLATATGAGTVVRGAYYIRGDSLEFAAEIVDARTARTLRALGPVRAPRQAALDGVDSIRRQSLRSLSQLLNPALGSWIDVRARPPSLTAYAEYVAGLENFWRDHERSVFHFKRAAANDSAFLLPLLWLVEQEEFLDRRHDADSIAQVLHARRDELTPFDRYELDRLRASLRGDRVAAYEQALLALRARPGSEVAVWRAACAALNANRPHEAARLYRQFDPRSPWCDGCEYYWFVLTASLHMAGDHEEELRQARRGVRQYPRLLSPMVNEMRALAALGRVGELAQRLEASKTLGSTSWLNHGGALDMAAAELSVHGHHAAAGRVNREHIAWYNSLPPDSKERGRYDTGYAMALQRAQRWEEARAVWARLKVKRPLRDHFYEALGAVSAVQTGHRAEVERTMDLLERLKFAPYDNGTSAVQSAMMATALGDRGRAVALLKEAFSRGAAYDVPLHTYFEALRDYPPFQELMRPKG